MSSEPSAQELVDEIDRYIAASVERFGSTEAIRPGHRIPFEWPPHRLSLDYHVVASDWTRATSLVIDGEEIAVEIAQTPFGVFGRSPLYRNEARGETEPEMLRNLTEGLRPLLDRQRTIALTLERQGRVTTPISQMEPDALLKLLYCRDRDVAGEAHAIIERQASRGIYGPALIRILRGDRHPYRRIAHWCVLDLFEDLRAFCPTPEMSQAAVDAIKHLLMTANDDYARAIYKAGVVLGGHVCTDEAADALLEALGSPSRIGRRSAVHGLFHLAEWREGRRDEIVAAIRSCAEKDAEPLLAQFGREIADDIESQRIDHATEPIFEDEVT